MKLGVLFICLFLFNNLFAQELTFLRYTNKNGLPSNEVFGMAIDRKGYLWICTDKGISKFDGTNFKTYTSLDGLKDNVFFKITHDYKDRIWLWSFNQNYNYISEGKIYTYKYNDLINKLKKKKFLKGGLLVGRDDKMLFSLDDDFFSISKNGEVEYYDNIMEGESVIIAVKDGKLINQGIEDYNLKSIENDEWIKTNLIHGNHYVQFYTKNKISYFFSKNELLILNNGQRLIKKFNHDIVSICVDNGKKIWVSLSLESLLLFENINANPKVVLTGTSGKLICDRNGNVWFSDSFLGLFKFHNSFIEEFELKEVKIASLILPTKSNLIIDTYENVQFAFANNQITKNYENENNLIEFLENIRYNQNKVEFYGTSSALFEFQNDSIYRIKSIQKVDFGYVIGSHSDFYILKKNGNILEKFLINDIRIKDLYYISESQLFFAAIDGIYILNLINGKLTKITDKIYKDEHTQVIKRINDYLLFGTKGKGIAVYSIKDKRIVSFYHQQNSQMPNSINAIHIEKNLVWIGTNKGIFIYRFDNGKLFFENMLNVNNGLSSNDILGITIIDNQLYCVAENFLNRVDLKNKVIFNTPVPVSPEIITVRVSDEQIEDIKNIKTNYKKNDIEIHFNSAYLLDKSRISYKYRLQNYDNKWQITQNNFIRYNNIPPGEYTLEIYASLDDDAAKSEVTALKIAVTQPFWLTLEFKILMAFLLIFVVFGMISLYFYQKSQKNKRRMQVIDYQQQALRAQMKPHFIFNALNSIQNFILKNNVNEALDFIERFAKLTRTVLNNTETEFSTFEEELRITRHYMDIEKIRFRNFDYKVNLSHELDASKYLVPSLILQPIVENSIWHGFQNKTEENQGLIIISAHINNEKFELSIEDNGIGRKATLKKTAHKSIALTTLRKRLDLLNLKNTNIEFVDLYEGDRAIGTKVVIRLSPNFK